MPVNIFGKEYKTVAERLDELYKSGKDYSLNTELISWENGVVIMKATLQIGENTYTGHAYEVEGSTQINNTSALENCETSCIGRSLASAGMGGSEFASADELANALGQQKASTSPQVRSQASESVFPTTNTSVSSKLVWSKSNRTITPIHFGKHKGTSWSEVTANYLDWLAHKSSLGEELKKYATDELDYRNTSQDYERPKNESGVIGVDDPKAYNKAVEKNKGGDDLKEKAEGIIKKMEEKADKEEKKKPRGKAKSKATAKKEEKKQMAWDDIAKAEELDDELPF
jgi:hypothetical protein